MRCLRLAPRPALTAVLLFSSQASANPHPAVSQLAGFSFNNVFRRWDCAGTYCGYNSQLCCTGGAVCYTDANNQAQCGATAAAGSSGNSGGHWQLYTTTYVMTDTSTVTKVMSSYVGEAQPTPTTGKACNYALNESPCGAICCASNQYCYADGQCNPNGSGPSSTDMSAVPTAAATVTGAGAPIRPTSSGQITQTVSQTATSTIPFMSPVATGSNVTLTQAEQSGGGGLSGGAIAGIVIGVLLGLALLGLLCFCCIVRGLWGVIFGGKKKHRRTEVEEYERRSHHAGGRTWYGAAKPSRTSRYEEKKSEHHTARNVAGWAAGLAAFWAILGLKRKRQERRREDDRYTEYSYSGYDYTSSSSASSDDRRTRDTRRSQSRR